MIVAIEPRRATGWSTINGGMSWTPLGVLFDPAHAGTFWVFGNLSGTAGGAISTSDGGVTFHGLHSQEADGLSVDFSDPKRQTLVIAPPPDY